MQEETLMDTHAQKGILRKSLLDCDVNELRRKYLGSVMKLQFFSEKLCGLKKENDAFKLEAVPKQRHEELQLNYNSLEEKFNNLVCTSEARYQSLCKEKDEIIRIKDDELNVLKIEREIDNHINSKSPTQRARNKNQKDINTKSDTNDQLLEMEQALVMLKLEKTCIICKNVDLVNPSESEMNIFGPDDLEILHLLDNNSLNLTQVNNDEEQIPEDIDKFIEKVIEIENCPEDSLSDVDSDIVQQYLQEMRMPSPLSPMMTDFEHISIQTDYIQCNTTGTQIFVSLADAEVQASITHVNSSTHMPQVCTLDKMLQTNNVLTCSNGIQTDNCIATVNVGIQTSADENNYSRNVVCKGILAQLCECTTTNNVSASQNVELINAQSIVSEIRRTEIQMVNSETNTEYDQALESSFNIVEDVNIQNFSTGESAMTNDLNKNETVRNMYSEKIPVNVETQTDECMFLESPPHSAKSINTLDTSCTCPKNHFDLLTRSWSCHESSVRTKLPKFDRAMLQRRDKKRLRMHLLSMKRLKRTLKCQYQSKLNKHLTTVLSSINLSNYIMNTRLLHNYKSNLSAVESVNTVFSNARRRRESLRKVENWMQTQRQNLKTRRCNKPPTKLHQRFNTSSVKDRTLKTNKQLENQIEQIKECKPNKSQKDNSLKIKSIFGLDSDLSDSEDLQSVVSNSTKPSTFNTYSKMRKRKLSRSENGSIGKLSRARTSNQSDSYDSDCNTSVTTTAEFSKRSPVKHQADYNSENRLTSTDSGISTSFSISDNTSERLTKSSNNNGKLQKFAKPTKSTSAMLQSHKKVSLRDIHLNTKPLVSENKQKTNEASKFVCTAAEDSMDSYTTNKRRIAHIPKHQISSVLTTTSSECSDGTPKTKSKFKRIKPTEDNDIQTNYCLRSKSRQLSEEKIAVEVSEADSISLSYKTCSLDSFDKILNKDVSNSLQITNSCHSVLLQTNRVDSHSKLDVQCDSSLSIVTGLSTQLDNTSSNCTELPTTLNSTEMSHVNSANCSEESLNEKVANTFTPHSQNLAEVEIMEFPAVVNNAEEITVIEPLVTQQEKEPLKVSKTHILSDVALKVPVTLHNMDKKVLELTEGSLTIENGATHKQPSLIHNIEVFKDYDRESPSSPPFEQDDHISPMMPATIPLETTLASFREIPKMYELPDTVTYEINDNVEVAERKIGCNETHLLKLLKYEPSYDIELEVATRFKDAPSKTITSVIIKNLVQGIHSKRTKRRNKGLYLSPVQSKLLGFLCLLKEIKGDADCMTAVLDGIETQIISSRKVSIIICLSEFYIAYCKLYSNIFRVRFFIVKALYKMNYLVLPVLYTFIVNWISLFIEYQKASSDCLVMRGIVQIIRLRTTTNIDISQYNVIKLLNQCLKYPYDVENTKSLVMQLVCEYIDKPDVCRKYVIIMLCQNMIIKDVCTTIEASILRKQSELHFNEVKNAISCIEFIFAKFKMHSGVTDNLQRICEEFKKMVEAANKINS